MRVGLVGVPGSGKTELASALEAHYVMHDECACRTPVLIHDDYAVEAGKAINLDVGFEGGYMANIQIALQRIALERAHVKAKSIVTCGTLIETSCYMAGWVDVHRQFWQTDQEVEDNGKRIQATLMTLACLYMDTFAYDKLYYLPPIPPVEDERVVTLDRNIQAAFEAFRLTPSIPLMVEGADLEEVTAKRIELIVKEENEADLQRTGATTSSAD